MIKLPDPDTHCFDDDTGKDVWSYSPELVRKIVAAVRKEAKREFARPAQTGFTWTQRAWPEKW